MLPITGIILAGGKSLRMGREKSALSLGGENFLERIVKTVSSVTKSVLIVAGERSDILPAGISCNIINDIYHEIGPMGGLHAGLSAAKTDWCFLSGCDTPFLESKLIRYMFEYARPDVQMILPKTRQGYHPLLAFYQRSLIPVLEKYIQQEDYSLHRLIPEISTIELNEQDWVDHHISELNFININTPKDYRLAMDIMDKNLPEHGDESDSKT